MKAAVFSAAMAVSALALPQAAMAQDADKDFVFQTEEEAAQEAAIAQMNDAFAMFGAFFKADPLSQEQEALLPLATQMAEQMVPEGTLATAMDETMRPMITSIMDMAMGNERGNLAVLTGVDLDEVMALDDDAAEELLGIFDPQFALRNERVSAITFEMIATMMEALEPAYREALARAFTTRFEEAEMVQLLGFFETPLGAKFAKEVVQVQYDPQMMGLMEQMGPAMAAALPTMMEQMAALSKEVGDPRSFTQLSTAERDRAAHLFGKSVSELEALQPPEPVVN